MNVSMLSLDGHVSLQNFIAHEDSTASSSLTWTNKKRDDDSMALDHDYDVTCDPMTQSIMSSDTSIVDKEENASVAHEHESATGSTGNTLLNMVGTLGHAK